MYNFVKKGAMMLFVAALTMGVASCSDDDPDLSNVTPPVVQEMPAQITGKVSAISGDGISGAAVKAGNLSATTKADGTFVMENVATGTYTLEVSAEGKESAKGSVTISKTGEIAIANFVLANKGVEVAVSETEATAVEVKTETAKDNKEAEVAMEVTVPAAALSDNTAKITFTAKYSEDAVTGRAAKNTMLMGLDVACNKSGVTLTSALNMAFELGEELAALVNVKKYVGGKWSDVASKAEGGKVNFDADEFGTYSVFFDAEVSSKTSSEAVTLSNANIDNTYGSQDQYVSDVTYTYKQGGEVASASGKLGAYLRQLVAQEIGATSVTSATGAYALNMTLPMGTGVQLSASQKVTTVTASCKGKSVSGKSYGTVSVSATTYNRQHTGGSN